MKVVLDASVRKVIPELEVFYKVIQVREISDDIGSLNLKALDGLRLSRQEKASYSKFREKFAESSLLAVERLKSYPTIKDLPVPDPLTGLIIKASYYTDIPITVFSVDEFNSVEIRFSVKGEYLKTKNGSTPIKPHSIIAVTEKGILGILGIRSSYLGKLKPDSQEVAVLSFGCSQITSIKSKELLLQTITQLQTKLGEKK